MTTIAPYNANSELVAMKEDIANRTFRVKMIGMAVTALFAVAAAATLFALPILAPHMAMSMAPMAKLFIAGGMAAASWLSSTITMKEVKKLEMDQQYLQSYMQGKNYWGEGYREEVAEHGHGFAPSHHLAAAPPSQTKSDMLHRRG